MNHTDLQDIMEIQSLVYPHHLIENKCTLQKILKFYAEGCFVLRCCNDKIQGYLFSHPFNYSSLPPAVNGEHLTPNCKDVYYIHDVAVHPAARGQGAATLLIQSALNAAATTNRLALTSVQNSSAFWAGFGFLEDESICNERLRTYGESAIIMTATLDAIVKRFEIKI